MAYIEERLPGNQIKAVKVDGMCILHSFREALDSIGVEVTLEKLKSILKLELSTNKDYGNCTTSEATISNEQQLFLNSPMTYYNADTTDLLLFVLGNFFCINIVIFKSNERECWAEDLTKMMTAIEKLSILLRPCPSILIPQCLSPHKTRHRMILQKSKMFYKKLKVIKEVQEVKPRSSCLDSRKADKEDDSGITGKLFSCIFCQVQSCFFRIHFHCEHWRESTVVLRRTNKKFWQLYD